MDDCLQHFKFARKYQQYKEERNLVDFDDLLILTYIHASQNRDKLKKYSWIQIDEVQDLSPFQFGIIDLFTDRSKENVTLYLGDEQQAIFSFIGAKLATLEWLRERCGENMHRLFSTTVPRNISWMSSTHTPTWSLMLTLISCLRRTILLKPDRILSASCPLPKGR